MRVAIYARVSTIDQNCGMQLGELREYCQRRKWEAVEYVDRGQSGGKASRPELDRLMRDAQKRMFETVIVWALDRWGRSVTHLLASIEKLSSYGVGWMSYTQGLDTSKTNPTGQMLLTILGAVAEFERALLRERVNSGLKSYREAYAAGRVGKGKERQSKSGKNLPVGRQRRIFDRPAALAMRAEGISIRKIARHFKIGKGTAERALRASA